MYGSFTTQKEIFDETLSPIIDNVLTGFDATVFAYGQTGTGKTYTMEGAIDNRELMGKCQWLVDAKTNLKAFSKNCNP